MTTFSNESREDKGAACHELCGRRDQCPGSSALGNVLGGSVQSYGDSGVIALSIKACHRRGFSGCNTAKKKRLLPERGPCIK